jgi:peptidoglycan hydrolase-like protein with peptidoglycan-binding domain
VPTPSAPTTAAAWNAPVLTTAPSKTGQSLLAYRTTPLTTGSHGTAVRALQLGLRAIGHQELVGTGTFGPTTKAAVVAFQRSQHLAATGRVDAATWTHLIVAVTLYPYRGATLKLGSTGAPVRALQWMLRLRIDGSFGTVTRAALLAYQRAHAQRATGTVARATWSSFGV